MNYEDMSDMQINKRVARALDLEWNAVASDGLIIDGRSLSIDYCNNPSDAWPIIVDSAISIQPVHKVAAGGYYKLSEIKFWTAWATNRQSIDSFTEDKNPLRAAMICFLKMKDAEQ